ncbi:hypothetical protein CDAR_181531 [Caerostris darwini]|uniref:Uncharacterized protein n=1 Tax=Caerostris darwini TaxID=1538125 RepID=A0AAV4U426_9ARAC|nr:hypothetical protein CDAR_181531 [Caerostris darwini]
MFWRDKLCGTLGIDCKTLRTFSVCQRSKMPTEEVSKDSLILPVTIKCRRASDRLSIPVMLWWYEPIGYIFVFCPGIELQIDKRQVPPPVRYHDSYCT